MPKPLSLGTLEWDSTVGDDDRSSRWSLDEQEGEDPWVDHPPANHLATPITLRRSNPRLLASATDSKPTTPQHYALDHVDRDARSSIFDWSEQQPADKSSGNRTPPRPRTVHGKKDANRRDSRSVGRRAPSGLHARSQSVPVVPDVVGKRNTVVTNKFGTWGIGSKGVTEDWNDDFDFSELAEEPTPKSVAGSQRIDSGSAMVVPKSIQEQQNNVLANISLLREWGLLIEELKEHRIRAVSLGIVEGPHSGMWEEVDAMIDLADQEAEHAEVPHASPLRRLDLTRMLLTTHLPVLISVEEGARRGRRMSILARTTKPCAPGNPSYRQMTEFSAPNRPQYNQSLDMKRLQHQNLGLSLRDHAKTQRPKHDQ